MDLTPETLRSATFRDKLRGYHPDDVDDFLESVARGLEVLLARLRDTTERARATQPAQPKADSEEAVRTLTLAQRTADLAVREAKIEAERLVRSAEERAQRIVDSAEQGALQLAEEAQAELRADLQRLQAARDQLFGEVDTLGSWLSGERSRIKRAMLDVADRIETIRESADAPTPKAVSVPEPPRAKQKRQREKATPTVVREPTPPRNQPASPPRGQPATAPGAAPSPRQPTPPRGQPAVPAEAAPNLPRFEPAPLPPPVPARAEKPQLRQPPQPEPRPEPPQPPPDMSVETPAADPEDFDDDPYFAELRRAMNDKTPLGPREDDWGSADTGDRPPPGSAS